MLWAPRGQSFLGVELPLPFGRLIRKPRGVRIEPRAVQSRRGKGLRRRPHLDAIHRTRGQAQLAAGADILEHRMHVFLGADDGIDRAGRKTSSTADAA